MDFKTTPLNSLKERDLLLQEALRPDFFLYGIASEYPLVLSNTALNFSYILSLTNPDHTAQKVILAHANLWPRRVYDTDGNHMLDIGLVGNVAVHKDSRKQGLSYPLMEGLKAEALRQNLKALVLWSDQNIFYKKLGFLPLGEELRFTIRKIPEKLAGCDIRVLKPHQITLDDCREFLAMRAPTLLRLERSPEEFLQLLHIPDVVLIDALNKAGQRQGFAIMGKGCDMAGVVHEWGSQSFDVLQAMIRPFFAYYPEVVLLTPKDAMDQFQEFSQIADVESHAGAWYLPLTTPPEKCLGEVFFWGLDAI